MDIRRLIETKRDEILRIAAEHGACDLRLFGSAARVESELHSDVDLLVRLQSDRSLLDQVALSQDLEEILGRKVDVVIEGGISPYLEDRILAEATPL